MGKAAPHMTRDELNQLRLWQGSPGHPGTRDLWKLHVKDRKGRRLKPLCLRAFRNVLKGKTYNSNKETRGRKRKLQARSVEALNKKRRELVLKSNGQREVSWDECVSKARVKKVHATTAARSLVRAGIPVAARRPREKPERTKEQEDERREFCRRWRRVPRNYFSKTVDLIIDNKYWDVPTTRLARTYKSKMRVRFQNRTRTEGLEPQYTRPHNKRHRKNLGGALMLCAGIRKNKVVLWKYLDGKWNGQAAEELYRNDIAKVLRRHAPAQAKPVILEDNDPTGYKSNKAKLAKQELGFKVLSLPRYSPDLNPLDFFLWDDIEQRMQNSAPKNRKETVEEFKMRLRKTAMGTSQKLLGKAIASIKDRVSAIFEAHGGHIAMD